ncbi:MAG: hypothetical protein GC190_20515, partial [Alphaproteobacteria bacterium]|nr:hypothetical protein [Alphaproteobacteria bacterium]
DALQAVGGQNALAKKLETTQSTIWHWVNKLKKVPAERVVEVETATGVPRERLRPDLYRDGAGLSSAPATRTGAIQ